MGPAFIAAIGYIDPGNFATNIQAGASFGYQLLWVVVWANLMAMLIQILSAKLGIATGKNLAEQIRDHYPRPVVWFYWVQAEIIAMATDLAEFIGAAIGFKLILGVSLLQGAGSDRESAPPDFYRWQSPVWPRGFESASPSG
ncbi:hypothetical protein AWF40_17090 [Escherichia coli]|nr:hypothetical protein AWF40_17090 [Escherichia coli]